MKAIYFSETDFGKLKTIDFDLMHMESPMYDLGENVFKKYHLSEEAQSAACFVVQTAPWKYGYTVRKLYSTPKRLRAIERAVIETDRLNLSEDLVKIEEIGYSKNGFPIGFNMHNYRDYISLHNYFEDDELDILSQVSRKLKRVNDHGIVLGDIHGRNILVNPETKDVIFVIF